MDAVLLNFCTTNSSVSALESWFFNKSCLGLMISKGPVCLSVQALNS